MRLKYGRSNLELSIHGEPVLIKYKEPSPGVNRDSFFQEMENCILSILPSIKTGITIGIVVADKTRLSEYQKYLPWVIDSITASLDQPVKIRFYVAYGTHPRQSDKESLDAYGESYLNYDFIHHNSETSEFDNLGKTTFGTEALINKDTLKCDIIITFGAISHHYFAGFGGGRKLMFPGLGAKKSILHNHSLFLNFKENKLRSKCNSGILTGNPVAEDLKEIYNKLPVTIGIHSILNSRGEVVKLYVGKNYKIFERACSFYESHYKINTTQKYDLVIASAGGYPKDINFIQSHKSLHNAASIVKDGGTLILLAKCKDGIGNNSFLELIAGNGWNDLFSKMAIRYENNAGTALALMQKTNRIKVFVVTSLPDNTCQQLNMKKININDVQLIIDNSTNSIAFIPHASFIYS